MFQLHNDMIGPYLDRLCSPEQRDRWFPGYCSGELIAAIAMTEPGAGSDLQGIRTTAVRHGDRYVLSGQKTFISNGIHADLVIVVARTDPEAGHKGISLLVVEAGMAGFERGRNLHKVGMAAQDTSELFFTDVEVPAENLLGEEGGGFVALMQNLPRERVSIGATALAGAEQVFADTLAYCQQRQAFGRPIGSFQAVTQRLADAYIDVEAVRLTMWQAAWRLAAGLPGGAEVAAAKFWAADAGHRVAHTAVHVHGGVGIDMDYPLHRYFAAATRAEFALGGATSQLRRIGAALARDTPEGMP